MLTSFFAGKQAMYTILLVLGSSLLLTAGCSKVPFIHGDEDDDGEVEGTAVSSEEKVFIIISPGVRHTFRNVRGRIRGKNLIISGQVEKKGHFEHMPAPIQVRGTNDEGKVVVKRNLNVHMERRRQSFTSLLPYRPDLEYSVVSRESSLFKDHAPKLW